MEIIKSSVNDESVFKPTAKKVLLSIVLGLVTSSIFCRLPSFVQEYFGMNGELFLFILWFPVWYAAISAINLINPSYMKDYLVVFLWASYYAFFEVVYIVYPDIQYFYLVHREWLKESYNILPWYICSATFAFATYLLQEGVKYLKEKKNKMK